MAIKIHFFKNKNKEKLDFVKLFEFFDNIQNFKIYYYDDEVEIVYRDEVFDFTYSYFVTKGSNVRMIYKLSPSYSNTHFLLVMPCAIPTFLAKEILTITQKICKLFELDIYTDYDENIKPFDFVSMWKLFEQVRKQDIETNGMQDKIFMDHEELNVICKYQRELDILKKEYSDVEVYPAIPQLNKATGENGVSGVWKVGEATIFPPYMKYVYIVESEAAPFMVTREDFYNVMEPYLTSLFEFMPDVYMLKERSAKKAKKKVGKLHKCVINDRAFTKIRLCDYIDRRSHV